MLAHLFHVLVFRVVTFAVWALAAASVAYWGLKLWAAPAPSMTAAVASPKGLEADPALIARALGAMKYEALVAQAVPLSSRFTLAGMVAGRSEGGVALIAVDGKPAKPVRVGGKVDDGLVLQSVEARRATLGETVNAPALFVLELPSAKK